VFDISDFAELRPVQARIVEFIGGECVLDRVPVQLHRNHHFSFEADALATPCLPVFI
jgi:hypothetical protein